MQDVEKFGATVGCPGCYGIKDYKKAQAHSDRCGSKKTSWSLHLEQRRSEVVNKACQREKTHSSLLMVTDRRGEERGNKES